MAATAYYGANYDLIWGKSSNTAPDVQLDGLLRGRVECVSDTFTNDANATPAVADYALICQKLPRGAIVKEIVVTCSAHSNSAAIDIGDGNSVARYVSAQSISSALSGSSAVRINAGTYRIGTNPSSSDVITAVDGDDQLRITFRTYKPAASGTVTIDVYFVKS